MPRNRNARWGIVALACFVRFGTAVAGPVDDRVEFRIVGPDGRPAPDVLLTVSGTSLGATHGVPGGRVVFAGADIRSVTAYRATTSDGQHLPWGPVTWERPTASVPTTVELRMPPERTISGAVHGAVGAALAELIVDAAEPGADWSDRSTRFWRFFVRPDGTFSVGGLGEGPYDVWTHASTSFLASDRVRARGGQDGVVLNPRRGLTVTFRTVDAAGSPVPDAYIRAQRPAAGMGVLSPAGSTDEHGVARLEGFESREAYRVTAQGEHGETKEWLSFSEAADITLTLAPAKTVRGLVHDPQGRPVLGARVVVRSRPRVPVVEDPCVRWDEIVTTDYEGRFTTEHPGPLPIELQADIGERPCNCIDSQCDEPFPEASHRTGPVVVATNLDETIDLTLDVGLPLALRFDGLPDSENWSRAVLADETPGLDRPAPVIGPRVDGPQFDFFERTSAPVDRSVARFRCLRPDHTYSVWFRPVKGNRIAVAQGLRGAECERRISLEAGLETRGRLRFPADATKFAVVARLGGLRIGAKVEADGRFTFESLPRGTWTVVASAERVGERPLDPFHRETRPDFETTAEVTAGGTADIVLTLRK